MRKAKRATLWLASLPVVCVVRLLLTIASHRAVLALMPSGRDRTAHPAMARRIGVAVSDASLIVPGASCLTQALAAQYLLALRGYASDLRIGVRTGAGGKVEAHAWLLSGPVIVVGGTNDEVASYTLLTGLTRVLP